MEQHLQQNEQQKPLYFSEETLKNQSSDPKRIGPGAWFFMEMIAVHASTKEEKRHVCSQIRQFCESFKCGQCQGHCRQYLQDNPPEQSLEQEDGLFNWVVTFRNSVQKRLGAPLYDREILFQIHTNLNYAVCEQDCANKNKNDVSSLSTVAPSSARGNSSKSQTSQNIGAVPSYMQYLDSAVSRGIEGHDFRGWRPQYHNNNNKPNRIASLAPIDEHPYIELSLDEDKAERLISSFTSSSNNSTFSLYPRYREKVYPKHRK